MKTTKNDKKKHKFSFSNPGSNKSLDKQSIETKRKQIYPNSQKCEYFLPFMEMVEKFKRAFMQLQTEDLVYNSDEIRKGELRAIDLFLRMNLKRWENDNTFQIEDLISDDYFQMESLKEIYETVTDGYFNNLQENSKAFFLSI